jgi:sec-independent protein translocase protein TatC
MFVAPGLYDQEKRYARPFVFFATIFFILGAAFCYYVVFPVGYRFFIEEYLTIGVSPSIRISEYLSFTARMLLAFGVTFELPVVTFFLARVGLVTHHTMLRYLRYAVLFIFIIAAVLTPGPDIASQLLMAGPLLVLYGLSIGVAYVFAKPRETPDEPA